MESEIKICAIDIDGVLCSYPDAWLKFANENAPKKYKSKNLNELKNIIPFSLYRKLKEEYRLSGIKRKLPAIDGASLLTKELKKRKYIIVLLTKRPFLQYDRLFADTLFWLKENRIEYDLIFWGKDKHFQILKYFPRMKFLIEDNHKNANCVAKHGYKVYLLDNPYNQFAVHKNVSRIKKLREVLNYED